MRILVTGGLGFIGAHVAELLAERGVGVRVLDALHPAAHGGRPPDPPGAEVMVGDVREPATVAAALDDVDAVCHQAAMVGLGVDAGDVVDYVANNDLGTAVLLHAIARGQRVRRLVLASSMVVYGEGRYACADHGLVRPGPRAVADLEAGRFEPPCPACGAALEPRLVPEDAPADPRNVYAATKLHQEHLAFALGRETRVPVVALRYHNVYGPGMPRDTPYAGVASIFRSALARGEPPQVFEDGAQRRDFVHVRDVARANVLALLGHAAGAFNVASGEPHTVGDMAGALAEAAGGPPPVVTAQYRLGDVRHVVADPARAAAELGFRARIGFADGMRELADAPLRASGRQVRWGSPPSARP